MINYDSILSAFDGKPTLLQWLKMVKKALDESILKNVNITQNGEKVVFSFNFEDGTSISTPEVTLPKGDKGDTGATGAAGPTGPKGNDGVSITGIDTVGNEVVGDETLTTLRARYSNNTTGDFVVTAKNGKDASASGRMYLHSVKISDESNYYNIYYNFYSSKENITLEDAIKYIPNSDNTTLIGINKVPICCDYENNIGVISAIKNHVTAGYNITVRGVFQNTIGGSVYSNSFGFTAKNFVDTLIG